MSNINQLTALDQVSGGDLVPLWSGSNGDTRRVSISALVSHIVAQLAGSSGFVTQYAAPNATGFSVQVVPFVDGESMCILLTPTAGYAAGTLVLPAVALCQDGQEVLVSSTQAVTALTVSGNGATAVNGAPTTLAANAFFRLRFDAVLKSWFRVG